jgi:anti-anti-sigma factor
MTEGPDEERLSRTVGTADKVREAFNALPLLAIAFEGAQLRTTATSKVFRAAVGRSEIIGVPVHEAFAEMAEQRILNLYDEVYATGQPAVQREFRIQVQSEHGALIEMYLDFVLAPMRAADGTVTGVIGTAADVTGAVQRRRAAEQRAGEAQRRYAEARDVIHALQRELLPRGVPVLPGLRIAASYLLADADTSAGGDWFDALALPDGRVALVVGDVVGHGVAASAAMGQLRVVLRERVAETGELAAAIGAADRMAQRSRGARAATVCVVLLDPGTGALSYCTAGHPPPLVLPADGDPRYLPGSGAGPLGVGSRFPIAGDQIGPGEMLLLYTDGILERPGLDLSASTVELARVAADVAADRVFRGDSPSPVDRLATQTLELLTRVTGHTDDITLLAAQRIDSPAGFASQAPADTAALGELRDRLGGWLDTIGVSEQDAGALQHAITELATNAVQHAYLDSPDQPGFAADQPGFTVTAALTPTGRLHAEVRDSGRWRAPSPSPERGLGLLMASKLVDGLHLSHDDSGTTATLDHELSRTARLLTAADLAAGVSLRPPGPAEPFLILDQPSAPSPRIRVDGPVDAHTAPQMDDAIRSAGAVGTRDLVVDLTGVTHLASAGVAALHQLAALAAANGGRIRLYAPPGSTADIIMTLVDLAHETVDPHTVT